MIGGDVFVLGSGFSNAIEPKMPTLKELTKEVRERLSKSGVLLPVPLVDIDNRGRELEENIELWLTYLSQDQPWLHESFNQGNQALASRMRLEIGKVIRTHSSTWQKQMPLWLESLIKQWSECRVEVITLNYDTLVERAANKVLDPNLNSGSGVLPSQLYPPLFSNIRSRVANIPSPEPTQSFTYLKLHGSVNWHYSGRQNFYGETIYYSDISAWGLNKSDAESQSLLCSEDKDILLIPPVLEKTTFFNNETVRMLWQKASEALDQARRVFVIGYSLPASDLGMRFFLKKSLPPAATRWYIVDKDPCVKYRYKKWLGTEQKIEKVFSGEEAVHKFADAYVNGL